MLKTQRARGSFLRLALAGFCWIAAALAGRPSFASPDISVTPAAFTETLLAGEQVTRTLTIANGGASDLTFQIRIQPSGVVGASRSSREAAAAFPRLEASASETGSSARQDYAAGHVPTRGPLGAEPDPPSRAPGADLRILLLHSGAYVSEIQALLAAFPDVAAVDVFDASYAVPTLAELSSYRSVIVTNNYPFADSVGVGDVLADYVDAGGTVVQTVASFIGQWRIQGRFQSDGYSPFGPGGSGPWGPATLGAFDELHPIMSGVAGAWGDLLGNAPLAGGADLVASWNNGFPFVVTLGRQVVGINIFVATAGHWTGDIPLILHNAARWGSTVEWASASPTSGIVPPGATVDVAVTFDAAALIGGDYGADIVVLSDDPEEPRIVVPAHLHVTGVPNIVLVGEELTLDSVQDYSGDGARTTHSFPVNSFPSTEGRIEIIADGDYGDSSERATVTAEGHLLGSVGAVGYDCSPATGTFDLSAAELAALASDGAIQVEVQNSGQVNSFCSINRHTLRLSYRGAADLLDFGSLFLGLGRSLSLVVHNTGSDVLSVSSISSDSLAFTVSPESLEIPVLGSTSVTVTFRPTVAGVVQGGLTLRSNDPDEPEVSVALRGEGLVPPDISVAPALFDESLFTGDTVTRTLTIENSGGSDLSFQLSIEDVAGFAPAAERRPIAAPKWGGGRTSLPDSDSRSDRAPAGSWLSIYPPSGLIAAGTTLDVAVRFDAANLVGGEYDKSIVLRSNDPDEPELVAPAHLHVTGAPDLKVSPSLLDFGPIYLGQTRDLPLTVRNVGTDVLTVAGIGTGGADFSTDASSFVLAAGGSRVVMVTFAPGIAGVDEAVLTFSSDDPDQPALGVSLAGVGLVPPVIEVAPGSLSTTLNEGVQETQTLTISNAGGSALEVSLRSLPRPGSCLTRAALVTELGSGELSSVDLASGATRTVAGGLSGPTDVVLTPSGESAYVLEEWGGTLSEVDLRTGAVTHVAQGFYYPLSLALNAAGTRAFVTDAYVDGYLLEVDLSSGTVTLIASGLESPIGVAVEPDGRFAYVAEQGAGRIVRVNLETGEIVPVVIGLGYPTGIALRGTTAFVTEYYGSSLTVAQLTTGEVTHIGSGLVSPKLVALDERGTFAYVAEGDTGEIAEVDLLSGAVRMVANRLTTPFGVRLDACRPRFFSIDPVIASVPAGGSLAVPARFDSTGLIGGTYEAEIEITCNDPVTSPVVVPAVLQVIGVPHVVLGTVPVTLDSVADYDDFGAQTWHNFFLPTPPVAEGQVELIADGAYGDDTDSATISAEGVTLGSVGATGNDCTQAVGLFRLSASELAALAVDSTVLVEVRNTPDVHPYCTVNRHTVRLTYDDRLHALEFGSLFLGASRSLELTVKNTGNEVLVVSSAATDAPEFSLSETSFEIAPHGSRTLTIAFNPLTEGSWSGQVTVSSNDPDLPLAVLPLHGVGIVAPEISVAPAAFEIALFTGETATRTLAIGNAGRSDLNWRAPIGRSSLENLLPELDASAWSVFALIPSRFDFSEGVAGSAISDGGSNMYEGGNVLGTNLGGSIPYANGVIAASPGFGPAGRYVTRKYSGLFVLAADMQGVSEFRISGNLGARSYGYVDGTVLRLAVGGTSYLGFVKRVYFAGTPSVNHLVIVEDRPGLTHDFSSSVDNDFDRISGLSGSTRLYYLLYAGQYGAYVDDYHTLAIMRAFLELVSTEWLTGTPTSGTVPAGEVASVEVTFDPTSLPPGDYDETIVVDSNDPDEPEVVVPVHLRVTGAPDISVTPSVLEFNPVFVGGLDSQFVTVRNEGIEPLSVASVAADHADFFVDGSGFVLAPGDSQDLWVSFTPSAGGVEQATLSIASDDHDEPVVSVPLRGHGLTPPEVSVAPASIDATLAPGASVGRSLTLENRGGSDLSFNLALRVITPPPPASRVSVLLLYAGVDVTQLRSLLAAFPDLSVVDVYNAAFSTPTLDFLRSYDAVMLISNLQFADPVVLGDRLADYVDEGGGVIETFATFVEGYEVRGRFASEGYAPFRSGSSTSSTAFLGTFDPNHPIFAGVSSVAGYPTDVAPALGAQTVGWWYATNSVPFVATKGQHVVGVNIYLVASSSWAGDVPLVLRNAATWAAGVKPWIGMQPRSGVVPPGSRATIEVTFDSTSLTDGDYEASLRISCDDPSTPEVIVPAHLRVASCVATLEACNGVDDDCDGSIDEDLGETTCGTGACRRTQVNCVNGVPQTCAPGASSEEICNRIDDDCDDSIDEGLGQLTCGLGACRRTVDSCAHGVAGVCVPGQPSPESCNGVDDDCDGVTDEALGQTTCGVGACVRTINNCVSGVIRSCSPGAPVPETCNGLDDDCDGVVDEQGASLCADGNSCTTDACVNGTCVNGGSTDADGDGICTPPDNCPTVRNPDQLDSDDDGVGDACEPPIGDSDGDGMTDDQDDCPHSILDPTVVIPPVAPGQPTSLGTELPCDSAVPNHLLLDGCTISDRLAACDATTHTNAQFFKCVKSLTRQLRALGTLSEKQRKAIDRCAKKAKKRAVTSAPDAGGTGAHDH